MTRRAPLSAMYTRPATRVDVQAGRALNDRSVAPKRLRGARRRATRRMRFGELGIGHDEIPRRRALLFRPAIQNRHPPPLRARPRKLAAASSKHEYTEGRPASVTSMRPLRIDDAALRSHQLRRPACRACRARPASAGSPCPHPGRCHPQARSSARPATARRIRAVAPLAAAGQLRTACLRAALRVVLHDARRGGTGAQRQRQQTAEPTRAVTTHALRTDGQGEESRSARVAT